MIEPTNDGSFVVHIYFFNNSSCNITSLNFVCMPYRRCSSTVLIIIIHVPNKIYYSDMGKKLLLLRLY